MRTVLVVALVCAFLTAPVAAHEELSEVKTVKDVEKLDAGTSGVRVHAFPEAVMDALAKRCPDLRSLHVNHPGNRLDSRGFMVLRRFRRLESLAIVGDPFLYDAEFALIGRIQSLRSLRLSLP